MEVDRPYSVTSIDVRGLWGYKDISLDFGPNVNIVVGENGSGKTTLLKFVVYMVQADVIRLSQFEFDSVSVKLQAFSGDSVRSLQATYEDEGTLVYKVSNKRFEFSRAFLDAVTSRLYPAGLRHLPPRLEKRLFELREEVGDLVPLVWLPVARRLQTVEDLEDIRYGHDRTRYERNRLVESVDDRLNEMLDELASYRASLDRQLSNLHKDFERQALAAILYDTERDKPENVLTVPATLGSDAHTQQKKQLLSAFEGADLLNDTMRTQIDHHFTEAWRVQKQVVNTNGASHVSLEDVVILTLANRTNAMADFARVLDEKRRVLFAPLDRFERTVNEFFVTKSISVDDAGTIHVHAKARSFALKPSQMSSGEKQLLILLIQSLLKEKQPVVYVVDEPELSLHVTWQGQLLEAIVSLSGEAQIIVATHSPDIVGQFDDKVKSLSAE